MNIIEHTFRKAGTVNVRKSTKEIILHCSATVEGKDYTVDNIDQWHKARGFSMIGYQFVIYRDGSIHRGRPENAAGGHCANHNSISIGVCYIGGVSKDGKTPKDTRTDAQKKSMMDLVKWLLGKYSLRADAVHGHYEFANKACPSFDVDIFLCELMKNEPGLVPKG